MRLDRQWQCRFPGHIRSRHEIYARGFRTRLRKFHCRIHQAHKSNRLRAVLDPRDADILALTVDARRGEDRELVELVGRTSVVPLQSHVVNRCGRAHASDTGQRDDLRATGRRAKCTRHGRSRCGKAVGQGRTRIQHRNDNAARDRVFRESRKIDGKPALTPGVAVAAFGAEVEDAGVNGLPV